MQEERSIAGCEDRQGRAARSVLCFWSWEQPQVNKPQKSGDLSPTTTKTELCRQPECASQPARTAGVHIMNGLCSKLC